MTTFIKETDGIYRLKIPFDTVYTSVFLIESDKGRILVDCATTREDVEGYILPALAERGLSLCDVDFLVLTHTHGDHAGGLDTVLAIAPEIEVVRESDMRELAPKIYTYALPGHTFDLTGVLDERTSTLISGDGIQGAGVDKYRCYLENRDEYIGTLQKLSQDERVENILFSHAYEPWYKDSARGRDDVKKCIFDCFKYV